MYLTIDILRWLAYLQCAGGIIDIYWMIHFVIGNDFEPYLYCGFHNILFYFNKYIFLITGLLIPLTLLPYEMIYKTIGYNYKIDELSDGQYFFMADVYEVKGEFYNRTYGSTIRVPAVVKLSNNDDPGILGNGLYHKYYCVELVDPNTKPYTKYPVYTELSLESDKNVLEADFKVYKTDKYYHMTLVPERTTIPGYTEYATQVHWYTYVIIAALEVFTIVGFVMKCIYETREKKAEREKKEKCNNDNQDDVEIETSIAKIATEITHLDEAKAVFSKYYYDDLLQKYNELLSENTVQKVNKEGYQKLKNEIINEYERKLPYILFDGKHSDMPLVSKWRCFTANDNGLNYTYLMYIYDTDDFYKLKIDPKYYEDQFNKETLATADTILNFVNKVWPICDWINTSTTNRYYYSIEIALGIAIVKHWIATHQDEYFCLVNETQSPEDLLEKVITLRIAGNGVLEDVAIKTVDDAEKYSNTCFDSFDCDDFDFISKLISTMYIPYLETKRSYDESGFNDQARKMYDQLNHIFNDGLDDEEIENIEEPEETNNSDDGHSDKMPDDN